MRVCDAKNKYTLNLGRNRFGGNCVPAIKQQCKIQNERDKAKCLSETRSNIPGILINMHSVTVG